MAIAFDFPHDGPDDDGGGSSSSGSEEEAPAPMPQEQPPPSKPLREWLHDWRAWAATGVLLAGIWQKWQHRDPYGTRGAHTRMAHEHWDFVRTMPGFVDLFARDLLVPDLQSYDLEMEDATQNLIDMNARLEESGDPTRPEATAFAVATYFCGPRTAASLWNALQDTNTDVFDMMNTAELKAAARARELKGTILCGHVYSAAPSAPRRTEHVFVLHGLPNATYHFYTSVQGKLPLQEYLAAVQRNRLIDQAGLDHFLNAINGLEKGKFNPQALLGQGVRHEVVALLKEQLSATYIEHSGLSVQWFLVCQLDDGQRPLTQDDSDGDQTLNLPHIEESLVPF